jgi:hypothetical protein
LYKEYEQEFDNATVFNPLGELAAANPLNPPVPGPPPPLVSREDKLLVAVVESERLSSRQTVTRRSTLLTMAGPAGLQRGTLTEDLSLTWENTPVS